MILYYDDQAGYAEPTEGQTIEQALDEIRRDLEEGDVEVKFDTRKGNLRIVEGYLPDCAFRLVEGPADEIRAYEIQRANEGSR